LLTNSLLALLGGAFIGLSAAWMMLSLGRIAGISGIWAQLLNGMRAEAWAWLFAVGLVAGGFLAGLVFPERLWAPGVAPLWMTVAAGLIVGWGTRMRSGCTSGHGVCGISRLSARSIIATVTFITTGAMTVVAVRLLGGGV
jgi:hypothetical protein